MSISPQSGARGLERQIWLKYDIVLKWQNTFNLGLNGAKIRITRKEASNKSCLELNFIQKSPRVHMSVSSQSGARGIKRLTWLKYVIVLKCQITFNLRLNTAKNTHHTKKASIKSSSELNFVQKSPRAHMFISPKSGGRASKDWYG